MTEPKVHAFHSLGLKLRAFEWEGEGDPILLVHAAGFHARCWDQIVAHLGKRRVIALDLMGHGGSDKPEGRIRWTDFGTNVADLADALDLRNILGVGHSLGGYAITCAAAERPNRFSGLLLIDPIITTPGADALVPELTPASHPTSSRRNQFSSVEEMIQYFSGRGSYALWEDSVLSDYCHYGTKPTDDGGMELACAPLLEAAIYVSFFGSEISDLVEEVEIPVQVVRARSPLSTDKPWSFGPSWTDPALATRFKNGKDRQFPELSHFIPMEQPQLVAQLIEEARRDIPIMFQE